MNGDSIASQVLRVYETSSDPYDLLLINRNSSFEEARSAYKKLLFLHPDKNPEIQAAEAFKLITSSFEKIRALHEQNHPTFETTLQPSTKRWSAFTGEDSSNALNQQQHVSFTRSAFPNHATSSWGKPTIDTRSNTLLSSLPAPAALAQHTTSKSPSSHFFAKFKNNHGHDRNKVMDNKHACNTKNTDNASIVSKWATASSRKLELFKDALHARAVTHISSKQGAIKVQKIMMSLPSTVHTSSSTSQYPSDLNSTSDDADGWSDSDCEKERGNQREENKQECTDTIHDSSLEESDVLHKETARKKERNYLNRVSNDHITKKKKHRIVILSSSDDDGNDNKNIDDVRQRKKEGVNEKKGASIIPGNESKKTFLQALLASDVDKKRNAARQTAAGFRQRAVLRHVYKYKKKPKNGGHHSMA